MSGKYSRRQVLRSGAAALGAIPFAAWFEQNAQAAPVRVRYKLSSPQGAAMLKHYRVAVDKMMKLGTGMPCGWTFQWYTHAVPTTTTKAAEVAMLLPAQQPLANEMWDTCEAHHATGVEDYFLPWHRMYVFFLERIVRKMSGFGPFTLPYWDYTDPVQRALPIAFRNPAGVSNPLYRVNRNAGTNAGQAIDQGFSPSPINLDAMKETQYSSSGAIAGFNSDLDAGLHGSVHVLVGNATGMGHVPFAANDPIFWMHHCNIDRIWASWNKAGGKNPTTASWLDHKFVFADENCKRVVGTIKEFNEIVGVGYTYDHFAGARVIPRPIREPLYIAILKHIKLPPDPGPLDVELSAEQLTQRLSALRGEQRVYLVVRDLQASAPVGVLYNLYLGLPRGTREIPKDARPAGTINFFDAMPMSTGREGLGKFRSFDVTETVARIVKAGSAGQSLNLTIAALGQPNRESQPVIGEVRLAIQ